MLTNRIRCLLLIFTIIGLSPVFALSDEAKAMLEKLKAKSAQKSSVTISNTQAEQPIEASLASTSISAEINIGKTIESNCRALDAQLSKTALKTTEQSSWSAPEDIFKIINASDNKKKSSLEKHIRQYPNSIKLRSSNGSTPLHDAAQWCAPEIVKFLLISGADVDAKNNIGFTPLDFASSANIEALKAAGAKPSNNQSPNIETSRSSGRSTSSSRPRLSNGDYTIHTGPRGGKYHYSASGKKVYHKKR